MEYTIVESTLSDGSKVVNVHLDQDGNKVVFHALNLRAALDLFEGLKELVDKNTLDRIT